MVIARRHATLILNVGALLAACVIAAETAYMFWSVERHHDVPINMLWPLFIPPALMFIANNEKYSILVLMLQIIVIAWLAYDCVLIFNGTPPYYDNKDFRLEMRQVLLDLLSIASFVVYLIIIIIRGIIELNSTRHRRYDDS